MNKETAHGTQIRLYKYLIDYTKSHNLEYSAAEVKKNILNYGVNINGEITNNQQFWIFFDVDKIEIDAWPKRAESDFTKVKVFFEDQDTLIINKPLGVVVEPGTGHQNNNLVTHLQKTYPDIQAVHRLDKDTSGLLILSKNKPAFEFYQKQFKERFVTKKYLALVNGIVDQVIDIENYQCRDKNNSLRQKFFWLESEAKDYDVQARNSHSLFKPYLICPELNQSIVEVQIFSGRMHQIRLQAEALGFSFLNDPVYNALEVSLPEVGQSRKVVHIPLNNKYTIEYFKQSLVIEPALDKPKLHKFYSLLPVNCLNQDEFNQRKTQIFGDSEYCLLSNYLEFELFSGRMIRCELNEV